MSISIDAIRHLTSLKTCNTCGVEKPLLEFFWQENGFDHFENRCKECANEQRRIYRRTKEGIRKRRDEGLRRFYGVTIEEYEIMLEKVDYRCEVCGKPEKTEFGLCIDHDHKTNKVRGILCKHCNHALGSIQEDALAAQKLVDYIKTRCT